MEKIKLTIIINTISFGIILGIYFTISYLQYKTPKYVPWFITGMNLIFPTYARSMTTFEKHETETDVQSSLFFKTLLFRLVTTVIILYIIVVSHRLAVCRNHYKTLILTFLMHSKNTKEFYKHVGGIRNYSYCV